MNIKIKKGQEKTVVGFNNSLIPLGQRDDLDVLADIAVRSNDQSLLDLFEKVPTLKELNKAKEAKFLEETKNTASPDDTTDNQGEPADQSGQ